MDDNQLGRNIKHLTLDLNSVSGMVELLNVMLPLYCSDAAIREAW